MGGGGIISATSLAELPGGSVLQSCWAWIKARPSKQPGRPVGGVGEHLPGIADDFLNDRPRNAEEFILKRFAS